MKALILVLLLEGLWCGGGTADPFRPVVINTWPFVNATDAAWLAMMKSGSAIDAVEQGCSRCEVDQCDGTVGYGGSPDESGETTLDAMIMDGVSYDVGAVSDLRRVKEAISVARAVMTYTKHTMLTGESATRFALEMGFKPVNLSTDKSEAMYKSWKKNHCQPNFRQNVAPDAGSSCGPYRPLNSSHTVQSRISEHISQYNHDTIGMIAIDSQGRIAGGTSTNGASHKIPGRVGDSPIPGAGAYVEQGAGGAAATGDGDVMMRFLPSFHAVSLMASGKDPGKAASTALSRITQRYPSFSGALIAINMAGQHGAACHGFKSFAYSVRNPEETKARAIPVTCSEANQ